MLGIKKFIQNQVNFRQVKALLWKDVLVRIRTPWMTLIQFMWPCFIFVALYALRLKFQAVEVPDCQFSTRQLPSQTGLLPFFQSYICTIDNECSNTSHYEEISKFGKAPATPIVNIVQTFLNEDDLYHAIVDLPKTANFFGTISTVATHPKFKVLEDNIASLVTMVQGSGSPIAGSFDIHQLWSDDMTFSKTGNVLCGKPFPRSTNIRFVDRVFYQEDFNGANKDELDVMPTKYCKQLYLDVTNTNNGKITWNYIKPIIQGKILYGPVGKETQQIMTNANDTLLGMNRLKDLTRGLDEIIKNLRVEGEFREKFLNIVKLAQSPFVKALIASFNVDIKILDVIFNALLEDKQVGDIVGTIANIFECFSVDRFIGVENEQELEDLAIKLNHKKLFLAGIYFEDANRTSTDLRYKLRMDIDNTPITLENRNRFWFPGPDANFELQMRYHRGFIQIQHIIDRAIMKSILQEENKKLKVVYEAEKAAKEEEEAKSTTTTTTEEPNDYSLESDLYSTEDKVEDRAGQNNTENAAISEENKNITDSLVQSTPTERSSFDVNLFTDDSETTTIPTNSSESSSESNSSTMRSDRNSSKNEIKLPDEVLGDLFDEEIPNSKEDGENREKRSPQFDLFSMLAGGSSTSSADKPEKDDEFPGALKMPDFEVFTKQFPYPKYRKDSFKTGLYLAQSVQLAFFFALIVQVSSAVRNRIWMKESGNSTLMRIMGLEKSSENTAWFISTFVEICFIFLLCEMILYSGGILETSSKLVIYAFLVIFACCVIAFCYMISTFFSSASIGSVSAVILFLMTYMPYIVIIALGTVLSTYSKILASLSISTAFCYAWHYILRLELQQKQLTFANAFHGSFESNDLKFGITMIIIDLILYTIIGYLYERFTDDEFKFHKVPTKDMDIGIGGAIQNCTKKFGDSVRAAVDNVSIVFRRDFITCLLGRNGAGKSTIIKLLTGQIAPTNGQVFLQQNLDRISGNEYKERVGLCSQNNVLIPNLTAKEHLELYARIKSNDKYPDREVDRVMNSLQFEKHENFFSQNLSGGFKRRLNVAIAFIASPNLVILDEPCSGVDTKARRNIWDLISVLRKGRAVILATHYLDEAENLSDSILILNEGKVVAEHDPDSLKEQFTRSFTLHIKLFDVNKTRTIDEIKSLLEQYSPNCSILDITMDSFSVNIPYRKDKTEFINYAPLLEGIEKLGNEKAIKSFRIVSSNLEKIFNDLVVVKQPSNTEEKLYLNGFNHLDHSKVQTPVHVTPIIRKEKLSEFEVIKALFKKRFLHFKRNYKLILCVLVLPTIFEIIAMGFMTLRPPGEHDVNLQFSRGLYKNSTELYSLETGTEMVNQTYNDLHSHCSVDGLDQFGNSCELFETSEKGFRWVLSSHDKYVESRYGGVSFNDSRAAVWYNNKGYHAMPVFLNELNSATLRSTVNNSNYRIFTNNHPLKLGEKELTTSSILQQVADAGISLILLVAFSLVVAGASVYIVNERLNGEKLQQKLCDVSFKTYWGVSFVWDFIVFIVALVLAVIVFKIFDMPVYTAKDNLLGICAILILFGFATIPMVHLFEKLFADASLANMYILCMNIIIALTTITIVILFDILGEGEESEKIRNFLNRAFLVLPQHALADGLIEICKNHIIAEVFQRYYINTYKSPVASDLLLPHFSALIACGILFIICNYIIESGLWRSWHNRFSKKRNHHDLEAVATVNQNDIISANEKYDLYNQDRAPDSLRVEQLNKTYDGHNQVLRDVTFNVKRGECFGLLGANGAGKSTIFGILSGELAQTSGTVEILNREAGISYCPQTNALDPLLTVEEIIHFYGKLRRIENIYEMTEYTLKFYHLLPYRKILVKHLSGGNRRKLSVAVTCFGSTSNVLMDEPTSDMDPVTRSIVYGSILQLMYDKRSVILTSHTITEIDRVCGRIGVLRQGQMIAIAPPQDLKTMYGNCYLITVYYDHIEALTIERDLKKAISGIDNLIVHSHCLQFCIKIKSPNSLENNNTDPTSVSTTDLLDGIDFSELFDKLHKLAIGRGIFYTITECLLDQAFDRIIESNSGLHSYSNAGYAQSETPT